MDIWEEMMNTAEIQQRHEGLRPKGAVRLGSTGLVTEAVRQALMLQVIKIKKAGVNTL
jgi:hypothetical protein